MMHRWEKTLLDFYKNDYLIPETISLDLDLFVKKMWTSNPGLYFFLFLRGWDKRKTKV